MNAGADGRSGADVGRETFDIATSLGTDDPDLSSRSMACDLTDHGDLTTFQKAIGGFAVTEDAANGILRDLNQVSALQRAVRETTEAMRIGSVTKSLFDQAKIGIAPSVLAEAQGVAGTLLEKIQPSTIAEIARRSASSGLFQHASRGQIGSHYAETTLRSSLAHLQEEFGERYRAAMREIAGIGSLGSVVEGLASGLRADFDASHGLIADAAAKAAIGYAANTGDELRKAHAALLPTLRHATAHEIERIVSATGPWSALTPYPDWMARAQAGVVGLSVPWVREDRPDLSLSAMARFGRLGGAVANLDPRDNAVTEELRESLGDYRGGHAGTAVEDDPAVRVAERYDRGFDPILSSMPTRIVLAMMEPFGLHYDASAADGEFGIDDIAAQMVRRLEARLMEFVRDALDAAWGDQWIMHVPGDVRGRLRRRQKKAEERGRPATHAIVHADFGDWVAIIGLEENWPLFAATFGSFDVLQETLEQIRPIRHDAAHPRGVGPEDLLVLAVAGKRVLRWIKPI